MTNSGVPADCNMVFEIFQSALFFHWHLPNKKKIKKKNYGRKCVNEFTWLFTQACFTLWINLDLIEIPSFEFR